jgi:hypothetical protein
VLAPRSDRVDHRRDLVALDAREDVAAEVPVEQVDVGAAHPDDLGTEQDLARPRLPGIGHVDDLHRALATGHGGQHERDSTPALDLCRMHRPPARADSRVVRQRRHLEAETF